MKQPMSQLGAIAADMMGWLIAAAFLVCSLGLLTSRWVDGVGGQL